MKKHLGPVFFIVLSVVCMFAFTNCSSQSSSEEISPAPAPAPLPPSPAPAPSPDIWNAAVGDLVPGATITDGWEDLRFVAEPVSVSGGWTDSAAISRDGMSLYFAYTRYNFADIVDLLQFNVTGPSRTGMTGDAMKNFRADLVGTEWVINYMPTNDADASLYEGALSANSAQDLVIFSRFTGPSLTPSLYYSAKQLDGTWSTPLALPAPLSGNCANDNGFIVGDLTSGSGVDIYFESDRTDLACTSGGAKKHIYFTHYDTTNDTYSPVAKVSGINGSDINDEDQQPFITEDGNHFYWTGVRSTAYGVFTADKVAGAFTNARPVIQPNFVPPFTGKLLFIGEPNIVETSEGYLMYAICGVARNESGTAKGAELKACRAKKNKYPAESDKINTAGWSDSPFISRDGQRLYFMYSRYDFAPWILSGGVQMPVIAGPDRLGLRQNAVNPFDESDIYMSTKTASGTWGVPVNLGLNSDYGDASGMEIDNGNTFVWLRGNGSSNRIVAATKSSDGTWMDPVDFGNDVNLSGYIQDNPHISPDGNGVWFVSDRPGGQGDKDIWFSLKSVSGTWGAPINLSSTFNSSGAEDQMWISPTTNEIYWNTASGPVMCVSNGSGCTAPPTAVTISGCSFVAEISMPDDGQTMYFGCGSVSTGRVSIMYSEKQASGTWGPATPVD